VHLSLHPRVIADNIVLGNAEWAREPNMAEIKRLDFRFDLLKLLGGKFAFPLVGIVRAAHRARSQQGQRAQLGIRRRQNQGGPAA
jgi:uncharacterized protein involved in outer membrane biogenesis